MTSNNNENDNDNDNDNYVNGNDARITVFQGEPEYEDIGNVVPGNIPLSEEK